MPSRDIVFRLEQLSGDRRGPRRVRLDGLGTERVREVAVEQHLTERRLIEGDREPYESERREQKLVQRFRDYLEGQGKDVCRLQFRPEAEPAPLYCDVYDKTDCVLYEAKGTVTREAVRMAIGQLADYGRLLDSPATRALLVPEPPRPDLLNLAHSQGLSVTWPADGGFKTTTPSG